MSVTRRRNRPAARWSHSTLGRLGTFEALEERRLLAVDLSFVPSAGTVSEENGLQILTTSPGSVLQFSVRLQGLVDELTSFQLNLLNSSIDSGQLQLRDWTADPAWQVPLDNNLDSSAADLFVAAGADLVGTSFALPVKLGTFEVEVPATPGVYLLSADSSGSGIFQTMFLGKDSPDPIAVNSFGDLYIRGEDALPILKIEPTVADQLEGDSGSKIYQFTVHRSGDVSGTSSVDFAVIGSGANPASASDFANGILPTGTIAFLAGETEQTISIEVVGDLLVESDEEFVITLSNPANATLDADLTAQAIIRNDDSELSIAATDAVLTEGDSGTKSFLFTVTRTGDLSGAASVDYEVAGLGTNPADSADFGGSFPAGSVPFSAGETSKTISIEVSGDTEIEPDESFVVTLTNPIGAQLDAATANGEIVTDDFAPTYAPLDVNQDGTVDASTDGNLILATLFDLPPSNLSSFKGSSTLTVEQIHQNVIDLRSAGTLDVNESGTVDASTDGNLILAVLFDLPDLSPFMGSTLLTDVQIKNNVLALTKNSPVVPAGLFNDRLAREIPAIDESSPVVELDSERCIIVTGDVMTVGNQSNRSVIPDGELTINADPGAISGKVWDDANGNGVQDVGETGLSGWKVYVDENDNGQFDEANYAPISSTNVPVSITDNNTVSSNLSVSGLTGIISDVNITLNISHTYDSDLEVSLIAPTGESVLLFNRIGGSGNNFTGTTLDDEAVLAITAGSPPFTGTFRPQGSLSDFDGLNPNGTWTLSVTDHASLDTGQVTGWSLTFLTGEQFQTTDLNGDFVIDSLDAGSYSIRQVVEAGWRQLGPANDAAQVVAVADGVTTPNVDFRNQMLPGTLRGRVWQDQNANQAVDSSEPYLANWTVYLDLTDNRILDSGEPTAVTDSQGLYEFTDLAPGSYVIAQWLPTNWEQTYPGSTAPSPLFARAAENVYAPTSSSIQQMSSEGEDSPDTWWISSHWSGEQLVEVLGGTVNAIAEVTNAFLWNPGSSKAAQQALQILSAVPAIDVFWPNTTHQYTSRLVPNDPLYVDQWHLSNTGQSGGTAGIDANISGVWDAGITGNGVIIGIVDDGLQHTHPDLTNQYLAEYSIDINGNDSDPTPSSADPHGTSVAGVAAASFQNNEGGSGVAPNASLAGIRLTAAGVTDSQEATGLTYQSQFIDVYNNSWGPADSGAQLSGPGPQTVLALYKGVTSGRGGLGNIYVWAAGNGLTNNDNVNYDGYASSRYTIAVAAVDHNGIQSYYSEPGASILITAPSNGNTVGITTTDLVGSNGYSTGNYTNGFGGTSSASPLVAGVVALMLEANPQLTWRDVQHILANSAAVNDQGDSDWSTNGGGHQINHKYGFGMVDAEAAVALAQSWTTVGAEVMVDSGLLSVGSTITEGITGISTTVTIPENILVESVEVTFSATHSRRGDLQVELRSPDGTVSILSEPHSDTSNNYNGWVFTTLRHWDELSAGDWTLTVRDPVSGSVGTLDSWQLRLFGTAANPIDTSVYHVNLAPDEIIDSLDFGNRYTGTAPPVVTSIATNVGITDPAPLLSGQPTTDWSTQRSRLANIEVQFSESIADVDANDLVLRNLGISGDDNPAGIITLADGQLHVSADKLMIDLQGLKLPDGVYEIELLPSIVSLSGVALDGNADGIAGDAHMILGGSENGLFQLSADFDGDANVSEADFGAISYWFGSQPPSAPAYVDLNQDSGVSIQDFYLFQQVLGSSLTFPTTANGVSVTRMVPAATSIESDLVSDPATDGIAAKLETKERPFIYLTDSAVTSLICRPMEESRDPRQVAVPKPVFIGPTFTPPQLALLLESTELAIDKLNAHAQQVDGAWATYVEFIDDDLLDEIMELKGYRTS
ncbi:Calcium-dependent protease precursor [Bremerella volcania]|uniref:Calcium-dependent protease n=1 Tax=Bremerella volcania TaxID=2527984 RepID=A0A518C8V9_9BACT|nr:S8 family serine peptidase [Bremerella volcania]QDU75666.1 Calcium-dependent protease precursor [Bremerella volcania]